MTYSKFDIKETTASKKRPGYIRQKNTDNNAIIQTGYPSSITRKRYTGKPDVIKNMSDDNDDINNILEKEIMTSEKDKKCRKQTSISTIMCGILSVVLLFVGIYLSGIKAPDYIRDGVMLLVEYSKPKSENKKEAVININTETEILGEKEFVKNETSMETPDLDYEEENNGFAQEIIEQGNHRENAEINDSAKMVSLQEDNPAQIQVIGRNMSSGSDKIYLTNRTDLKIDSEELLSGTYPIEKYTPGIKDEPLVLIVHTHGTEAYIDSGDNGTTRTNDTNRNVVRVGDELKIALESFGIPTIHSKTMHDEISYVNAYANSKKEVQTYLKNYPSIKYVIDLHRDALGPQDDIPVKTYTEINGEPAAQLMFVMGTNASGGNHPEYMKNLTAVSHIQNSANIKYPSLMRPINIRPIIFNQNLSTGCMILEVGSDANTLEEAMSAVRMFAGCFAETVCG